MAVLFGRNRTTISRHISNTFEQGEVDPKVGCAFFAQTTRHGAIEGKTQTDDLEGIVDYILEHGPVTNANVQEMFIDKISQISEISGRNKKKFVFLFHLSLFGLN